MMSRMTFKEFLQSLGVVNGSGEELQSESLSIHAKERSLERRIPEGLQKLLGNVFEPFLYYYLKSNSEFNVNKSGEKGTEFVVVVTFTDQDYCFVGTYKKDKLKKEATPFILWLTMFKVNPPLFIKSGTAYRFDIKELKENEKDAQITIRTNRRRFSFTIEKNPVTLSTKRK